MILAFEVVVVATTVQRTHICYCNIFTGHCLLNFQYCLVVVQYIKHLKTRMPYECVLSRFWYCSNNKSRAIQGLLHAMRHVTQTYMIASETTLQKVSKQICPHVPSVLTIFTNFKNYKIRFDMDGKKCIKNNILKQNQERRGFLQ